MKADDALLIWNSFSFTLLKGISDNFKLCTFVESFPLDGFKQLKTKNKY